MNPSVTGSQKVEGSNPSSSTKSLLTASSNPSQHLTIDTTLIQHFIEK